MAHMGHRKIGDRQAQYDNLSANPNDEDAEGAQRAAKIKVRYVESKQVREMREKFEKKEKIAMRSSRTYRYEKYIYSANRAN